MGASRERVLAAVRRGSRAEVPLPPLRSATPLAAAERSLAFETALRASGGLCVRATAGGLEAALATLPAYAGARRVYSALPGVARANVDAAALADPRVQDGLDFAVVPGVFGVAESGAVWVDGAGLASRALLWLAEHLALVVPEAALVDDLHGAYARLRFPEPGFGCFVAGPSKTADIEQALVIGAQGPRSLAVVLVAGAT